MRGIGWPADKRALRRASPSHYRTRTEAGLAEWMTAREAIDAANKVSSPAQGALIVTSRAYAGLVSAKAERLVIDGECYDNILVPKGFWWPQGRGANHCWDIGDFEWFVEIVPNRRTNSPESIDLDMPKSNSGVRARAFGVEFLTADIAKINPDVAELDDSVSTKAKLPQSTLMQAHPALIILAPQLSEEAERDVLALLYSNHHLSRDRLREARGPQPIGRKSRENNAAT